MTELTEFVITEPGIYDIPHAQYHADPIPGGSLSSTGVRLLTPPKGCPARYRYEIGRQRHTREFDFGQLAHRELLGLDDPEIVIVEAENYKTKDAQITRDEAYAEGKIPVLPHEWDVIEAMMQALREHPWAARLFEPGSGSPEQSFFWEADGVWRRTRLDFLSHKRHPRSGQLMIPEYKTAASAEKNEFTKNAYRLGYHQQGAWYTDAVKNRLSEFLDDRDPMFLFVVQEKTEPYIVNVIELDPEAMMWGRALNEQAVSVYRDCRKSGRWPGYSDEIELMPATPVYLQRAYEDYLDD